MTTKRGKTNKGKKTGGVIKLLLAVNILLVIALTLAYSASFISPEKYWLPVFAALGYPWILLGNVVFIFFWLVIKPRYTLLPIIAIVVGLPVLSRHIQFRYPDEFDTKSHNILTVKTHNVRNFDIWGKYGVPDYTTFDKMVALYKNDSTDVLCLQEAVLIHEYTGNLAEKLRTSLGYAGMTTAFYTNGGANGLITFFKGYKIDAGILSHNGRTVATYTDIMLKQDSVIRVYNIHLHSNMIGGEEYVMDRLSANMYRDSLFLKGSRKIAKKIKYAASIRAQESTLIKGHIDKSPYSVLVCGDLNDTPASYTYRKIKKGLFDSFIKGGRGLGRTYLGKYPSYRIDYILYSPTFKVKNYRMYNLPLGDHKPVTVWLEHNENIASKRDGL